MHGWHRPSLLQFANAQHIVQRDWPFRQRAAVVDSAVRRIGLELMTQMRR